MNKKIVFALLTTVVTLSAFNAGLAADAFSYEDALKEISGKASGAEQTIKQPENFVPHYNTSEQQGSGWYGSGELLPTDPGNSKISGCSSNPLDDNLYKRQECEGINLVMKKNSTRPNIEITNKDPIIGENKKITGDPLPIVQKYGINLPFQADGSIGAVPADACSPVSIVTAPEYEERLCTNYKASEQYLCKQNLVVKVNPQFNYRCNDVLAIKTNESCDKVLNVMCESGGNDCAAQGVIANSIDADMTTQLNPVGGGTYNLSFGVYQDNYWSGSATVGTVYRGNTNGHRLASIYYKKMTVNISGKERLRQFMLSKVHEDDYTLIKVNGVIAYKTTGIIDRIEQTYIQYDYGFGDVRPLNVIKVGPGANDYLPYNCTRKDFANTSTLTCVANVERAPAFNEFANPNFNALPYLNEGDNVIETWTLVGNKGELYTEWLTQQVCDSKCTESWQDNCSNLQQRAR